MTKKKLIELLNPFPDKAKIYIQSNGELIKLDNILVIKSKGLDFYKPGSPYAKKEFPDSAL